MLSAGDKVLSTEHVCYLLIYLVHELWTFDLYRKSSQSSAWKHTMIQHILN